MSDILLNRLCNGQLKNSGLLQHLCALIRAQSSSNCVELRGMDNIEILSRYLSHTQFEFKAYRKDKQLLAEVNVPKSYTPYISRLLNCNSKWQSIQKAKVYHRADIIEQYHAFKTCGISIGQNNCVQLAKVIQIIAMEQQTKSITFWGKILGYKDYWVIKSLSSKPFLSKLGLQSQPNGVGINTYSFWITTDILGEWVELPEVSAKQLSASREFKYIFTGNLEKSITNFPSFQGSQKHLLKCILSRITHSCELAPKGIYKLNEENPHIVEMEDEFKVPEVAEMNSLESWIHYNPHILLQGRTSYYFDLSLSEEEKQVMQTELTQKDPIVDRLRSITDDKPYEAFGYNTNWTIQLCGQTIPINLIGKKEGQTALYGVCLLKNLTWPGAYTVGYPQGWGNIYVGYGHRISQQNIIIKQIADLQMEAPQQKEKSEPNPSKPPPSLQKKKEPVQGEQAQEKQGQGQQSIQVE